MALRWRLLIVAVAIPVVAALSIVTLYLVDRAVAADEAMRNVVVEGRTVTGLGEDQLRELVTQLATERLEQSVEIRLPGLSIAEPAHVLGIRADVEASVREAMLAHRSERMVDDFEAWWRSWSDPVAIQLDFRLDEQVARAYVDAHPERLHRLPVEPWFSGENGPLEVQEPVTGLELDANRVVDALVAVLGPSHPPATVGVGWRVQPTEIGPEAFAAALSEAESLINRITVVVNERPAIIGAETVRRWIESETRNGEIRPVFVEERVEASLERLLAPLATEAEAPTFAVVDGEVLFELGAPALQCCDPEADVTEMMFSAAKTGGEAVVLPTRLVEPDGGLARVEALGITELVSEFTTRHKCCESRVKNIQRLADMVRGQVLKPGDRFSINEFVGPRTREKGFVSAGTIMQGHFIDDVGGGISQFATTMFNAAFFAGLDFDAYRSHTIYISRYPYGREATLSYPQPDLAVVNNTPYGLLVWTKYTGSSITVQIYSTKYWDVKQSGQTSSKIGACTRVNTFRTRTDPGGNSSDDMVIATYRPGEGIDCNGRAIPRPPG